MEDEIMSAAPRSETTEPLSPTAPESPTVTQSAATAAPGQTHKSK